MDLDFIFAQAAIRDIEAQLSNVPHGERKKIATLIITFAKKLKDK
jgi:hypothetical protein